jgi:hypothetical protein
MGLPDDEINCSSSGSDVDSSHRRRCTKDHIVSQKRDSIVVHISSFENEHTIQSCEKSNVDL